MKEKLHSYQFDEFTVQSYFDEEKTRRLYAYIRLNKLIGRVAPPRRAFIGLAERLLWEKKFTFENQQYIVQGGGRQLAIFDLIPDTKEGQEDQPCIICQIYHPADEMVETDDGKVCQPCYEVWFPPCVGCGKRLELSEDDDPEDGPFYCEECYDKLVK